MEQTEIAREQGAPAASILAEQAWEGKVRCLQKQFSHGRVLDD